MKNFIDFVIEAAKDSKLAQELEKHIVDSDHGTIAEWFRSKGYDVHEDECKKLKDNKDDLKNINVGYY
ncbi:MAG: hypothetical protein JXR86_05055 [Spirochaetales bacterium]|nr:hypothetical protein [Spirochaetales bacterium]